MAFKKLEKDIKEEELAPILRKAVISVRRKIPQIRELVEEGHGPRYIKEKIFGKTLGYNTMMEVYKILTGKKLVGRHIKNKHLRDNGRSYIENLVYRMSSGTNEIYDIEQGRFPGAVWKF